jgi:hypothetical protein
MGNPEVIPSARLFELTGMLICYSGGRIRFAGVVAVKGLQFG